MSHNPSKMDSTPARPRFTLAERGALYHRRMEARRAREAAENDSDSDDGSPGGGGALIGQPSPTEGGSGGGGGGGPPFLLEPSPNALLPNSPALFGTTEDSEDSRKRRASQQLSAVFPRNDPTRDRKLPGDRLLPELEASNRDASTATQGYDGASLRASSTASEEREGGASLLDDELEALEEERLQSQYGTRYCSTPYLGDSDEEYHSESPELPHFSPIKDFSRLDVGDEDVTDWQHADEDLDTPTLAAFNQASSANQQHSNSSPYRLQNVPSGVISNPRQRERVHPQGAELPRENEPSIPPAENAWKPDEKMPPVREPYQPPSDGQGGWVRPQPEPFHAPPERPYQSLGDVYGLYDNDSSPVSIAGEATQGFGRQPRSNYQPEFDEGAAHRGGIRGGLPGSKTNPNFNKKGKKPWNKGPGPKAAADRPARANNWRTGGNAAPRANPLFNDRRNEAPAPRGNPLFNNDRRHDAPAAAPQAFQGNERPRPRTFEPDVGRVPLTSSSSVGVLDPSVGRVPLASSSSTPTVAPRTPPPRPAIINPSPAAGSDNLRRYAGHNALAMARHQGNASPFQSQGVAGLANQPLPAAPAFNLQAAAGYGPPGAGASGGQRRNPLGLGPAEVDPFSTGNRLTKSSTMPSVITITPQVTPMYFGYDVRPLRSAKLNALTAGPTSRPSFEQAMDPANFPFIESAALYTTQRNRGVIKILNVPFYVSRAEIIGYLGRNASILNDADEPVHIIMERTANRTNDVYIEFTSMYEAINCVTRNQRQIVNGRSPRLGDRPATMELSSQSALLKDLFPYANGIHWVNGKPIQDDDVDTEAEPWNAFKGFVSPEQMVMLVKHIECPQRSPFSKDCPQRPYEAMISILKKMPWDHTEMITVAQRDSVYQSCVGLVGLLQHTLEARNDSRVNPLLLKRLVRAAMTCPGLTVVMKDSIAYQGRVLESELNKYFMPRFAESWVHAYSFAPKDRVPYDVIEWYIAVIREETQRKVKDMPFRERSKAEVAIKATDAYFGYFWLEAKYPKGDEFDNLTLAQVAMLEFEALENILRRALGGQAFY